LLVYPERVHPNSACSIKRLEDISSISEFFKDMADCESFEDQEESRSAGLRRMWSLKARRDSTRSSNSQIGANNGQESGPREPVSLRLSQTCSKFVSEKELSTWSQSRRMAIKAVTSQAFEAVMGITVFVNIIIMIVEADGRLGCPSQDQDCTGDWTDIANVVFLCAYVMELGLRAYAQRWLFWRSHWNYLDAAVVLTGTTDVVVTFIGVNAKGYGLSYIRLFRIARIVRAIRLFRAVPELYKLVKGFAGTMKAIFWGAVMIIGVLTLWSLVIVQYVQPFIAQLPADTEPWCLEAYSSVEKCVVLLFQTIITGDNWGTCSVPIIVRHPEAFFLFAGAFVTVQTGFVNLILAVIVDAAATAREEDSMEKLSAKKTSRGRQH
jgi:voltage-gated sodium channel